MAKEENMIRKENHLLFFFFFFLSTLAIRATLFQLQLLHRCSLFLLPIDNPAVVFYRRRLLEKVMAALRGLVAVVWTFLLLLVFLAAALVAGGTLVHMMAEEPLSVAADLGFDYSKQKTEAVVPIPSLCRGTAAAAAAIDGRGMEMIVSLTLPESDYNRHLGVFQVRADLLSSGGKITASSTRATMLRFKSPAIHSLQTFINGVAFLFGHSSLESQTLRIRMKSFAEATSSEVLKAAAVRIAVERRAELEYAVCGGGGIPEIYSGSVEITSDVPAMKKMVWAMRKTVAVWLSSVIFFTEVVVLIVAFRLLGKIRAAMPKLKWIRV